MKGPDRAGTVGASAGGATTSVRDLCALTHTASDLTNALQSARLELVDLDEQMRSLAEQAQGNPEAVKLYRALEARRPVAFYTVRALDSLVWLLAYAGGEHDSR